MMSKAHKVTVVVIAVMASAASATPAFSASTTASCMGIEASDLSPPGSSSEVPGGMPEFRRFVKENLPGPPGAFTRTFAHLHAGSHEACDEAVE
jgi:hypothetical protein